MHRSRQPNLAMKSLRIPRLAGLLVCMLISLARLEARTVGGPILDADNGHFYFLLSQGTWTASQFDATTLGGNLATIRNVMEHYWVYDIFGDYDGVSRHLWIGLNDLSHPFQFIWASGAPVTYTNWAPGERDDAGGEEYL